MDEKLLAKQLEKDIDRLLDGRTVTEEKTADEYRQALEAAKLLVHYDMSNESQVRKSLRQKLLAQVSDQRKVWSFNERGNYTMKLRKKSFVFAGILAILFLGGMSLPPVRALAQNLWDQIGPLIIVSETVIPWDAPSTDFHPTPIPNIGGQSPELTAPTSNPDLVSPDGGTPVPGNPDEFLTPQEALTRLNFKVLMPVYIPDGYTLSVAPNFVYAKAKYIVSNLVYTTADQAYLSIAQSTFEEQNKFPFLIGDAEVTEVTVRERKALFLEDATQMTVLDASGQNVNLPLDYLIWEEDGYFFMMNATELSQAEMILVAEALH